jgi:hypothetical protein
MLRPESHLVFSTVVLSLESLTEKCLRVFHHTLLFRLVTMGCGAGWMLQQCANSSSRLVDQGADLPLSGGGITELAARARA